MTSPTPTPATSPSDVATAGADAALFAKIDWRLLPFLFLCYILAYLDRVNVDGGAIALGHPLGASGARLMVTLISALERRGGGLGLQTMCEGGGMANATIVEVPAA